MARVEEQGVRGGEGSRGRMGQRDREELIWSE